MNKSFTMAVLAATSTQASADQGVTVRSDEIDIDSVDTARKLLRERVPSEVLANQYKPLVQNIRVDGAALGLEDDLNLAATDDSAGGYNCYSNCHSSCHGACHGSRGWR